jgi:pyruvate dehydrogenase E2 component (dihydrolipoamide acetyltransferase)
MIMKTLKFVDVGEGITEGHVRKWLVKDGENVKEDQSLVQIETDKAVVNLPAPISGNVKIVSPDNTTLHVGDVIAYVGELSEIMNPTAQPEATPTAAAQQAQPAAAAAEQQPQQQAQAQPQPQVSTQKKEVIATPAVRRMARELGIDIGTVVGTGPEGRILENDLKKPVTPAVAAQQAQKTVSPLPKFSELLEEQHGEEIERIPMSQTRKTIAKNMELSATIPRAAHMDLINATYLYGIVKKEKPNAEKLGVKLTFLPFIIKATVQALKENPRFNSSYDHDKQEVILKKYYNIGLAAEGPDGLKVIVIKAVDKKNILQIAKEIQDLAEKVKNQTISIDEMRDSTFTITNIGSLGGGFLSLPMINYPEVAILGVHLIRDAAMVDEGMVKIGKQLPFSIAFDHRVVDGAEAVLFGNALIKYLEDPEFLELLG